MTKRKDNETGSTPLTGEALISAMQASPHPDIEIAPPRARMPETEKLQFLRKAWQEGIDSGDASEIDFPSLKKEARTPLVTAELSDEEADRFASSRMDPRHDHLNKLLDPT